MGYLQGGGNPFAGSMDLYGKHQTQQSSQAAPATNSSYIAPTTAAPNTNPSPGYQWSSAPMRTAQFRIG